MIVNIDLILLLLLNRKPLIDFFWSIKEVLNFKNFSWRVTTTDRQPL